MKLSLAMLCSEIEFLHEPVLISSIETKTEPRQKLSLNHCCFYDPEETLSPDVLYLVTEKQIQLWKFQIPEDNNTYNFVFPNEIHFPDTAGSVNYTWPQECVSMEMTANYIFRIFVKYDAIDRKLTESLLQGGSLQQLVTIAADLFENEITIRDRDHRYVATSFENILFYDDEMEKQPDGEGYSSIEEINLLKQDVNYREQEKTEEPFYYPFGNHMLLCMDLYENNTFLYRIKISDARRPIRSYDPELLTYFAGFVKKQYLENRPGTHFGNKRLRNYILLLLEHKNYVDENELSSALGSYGWDINDTYLVICMNPGQNRGSIKAFSYYSRYLEQKISHIISIEWMEQLILIGNLTKGYDNQEHLLSKKIVEYIRDENYRAGISDKCHSFLLLHSYYVQAHAALTEGMYSDPAIWTYPFSKYRYHYLKSKLEPDFPDLALLMPGVDNLFRIDKLTGSENVKTIEIYLLCGGNMAKAARMLNIHHSTLSYRLSQISKILNLSLEDKDALVWLNLILKLKHIEP